MQRLLRMYGAWGIELKHRLQWKMIGIMFVSMLAAVVVMGLCEVSIFQGIFHMSAEKAEIEFAKYSYLFNLLLAIVAVFIFFLLSRKTIKRIERMNKNVSKIASGQMKELEGDCHKDELGDLSNNINTMALHIAQSIQKEQDMICNLAHDLRTPITSISGYIELLEKEKELSEEGKHYIDILSRKTEDLASQVNALLEYSILEFKDRDYGLEEISLSSLLEQVLIDFIPVLEQEGFTYILEGNTKSYLFVCNQMLFVRLFENLISNSIRYGKQEKKIEIKIHEITNCIAIDFSNYGELVSPEEEAHLFDAFYQGKSAKNYKTESKGLGLAIAKKITAIHHGHIKVKNNQDVNKVTFTVELPMK